MLHPGGLNGKLQHFKMSDLHFCTGKILTQLHAMSHLTFCRTVFLNSTPFLNFNSIHVEVKGCMMTPREQLRKMTALGEQGALDEKHWYRLVNGMSAGGEEGKQITRRDIYDLESTYFLTYLSCLYLELQVCHLVYSAFTGLLTVGIFLLLQS